MGTYFYLVNLKLVDGYPFLVKFLVGGPTDKDRDEEVKKLIDKNYGWGAVQYATPIDMRKSCSDGECLVHQMVPNHKIKKEQ